MIRSQFCTAVLRAVPVTCLLFVTSATFADARDPAAADLLFSAGREAFERGDYQSACTKFEESQRLDPAPGTLMNLGACNEKLGRLAVAWEHWREALRLLGKDDERYPRLEARLRALEIRVPKLEVNIAQGAPPETQVMRDGVPLRGPALGVAIPVNPGEHIIEASAPGRSKRRYTLNLEEGRIVSMLVEPGAILPQPASSEKEHKVTTDSGTHAERSGNSRKQLGFIIGGAGILGLAVAGTTGFLALREKGVVNDECEQRGSAYLCNAKGLSAAEAGETYATISTVSAIVGGGALLVGGYLLISSGTSKRALVVRSTVQAGALQIELSRSF